MTRTPSAFLLNFMLLAAMSGITIGMGKVVTTLYAVHIGADPMAVGLISSLEALGRFLMTLPAGFLIATYGARRVYFISSFGPMVLSLIIPWMQNWHAVALVRGITSLCIPFRAVSMNSSFLQQLQTIGTRKAGWYRASQTLGMGLLGPLLGSFFTENAGYLVAYGVIGLCFGIMAFYGNNILPAAEPAEPTHVQAPGGMIRQSWSLLREREIRNSCLIEFVTHSTTALFQTYIILIAIEISSLNEHHGVLLMLVQSLSSVTALFLLGYSLHRLSRSWALLISMAVVVVGLLWLAFSQSFWTLALGTVLMSAGTALIHLVKVAQLSSLATSKSKISSLFNLATIAGAFFGATLGALLSSALPLQKLFLVWIPLLIITTAVAGPTKNQSIEPSLKEGEDSR